MKKVFENEWQHILQDEFDKPYYEKLRKFVAEEYSHGTVYPPKEDVMNALHTTSYSDVKVVILGQDPYHGPNQAHGMSFSVKPGVPQPPSLKNMLKELQEDLGYPKPSPSPLPLTSRTKMASTFMASAKATTARICMTQFRLPLMPQRQKALISLSQ